MTPERRVDEERDERVDERIRVIEKIGQHGRMPSYWREALYLSLAADDIAVTKVWAALEAAESESERLKAALESIANRGNNSMSAAALSMRECARLALSTIPQEAEVEG